MMHELSAIYRPFLAEKGSVQGSSCSRYTCQAVSRPAVRPGGSIFVDGAIVLFPQMDDWPRCHRVGPTKRPPAVRGTEYCHRASGDRRQEGRETSASP